MKKTTSNMKAFWHYINERESIRINREKGNPKPWTKDALFQNYKFTNVFRQDDRTTKELLFHLDTKKDKEPESILFNIALFRLFNWGPTFNNAGGWCDSYNASKRNKAIKKLRDRDRKVFTGAYIITSCGKSADKIDLVTDALEVLWKDRVDVTEYILYENTIEHAVEVLSQYPMIGKFVAYELACDLTYTNLLKDAVDLNDWANPGPGAKRGLNRIFRGERDLTPDKHKAETYLEEMRTLFRNLPANTGQHIKSSKWACDMRVIENALCETDKYLRLSYNEGKVRSKYNGTKEDI